MRYGTSRVCVCVCVCVCVWRELHKKHYDFDNISYILWESGDRYWRLSNVRRVATDVKQRLLTASPTVAGFTSVQHILKENVSKPISDLSLFWPTSQKINTRIQRVFVA
jgi:hypothetical protein